MNAIERAKAAYEAAYARLADLNARIAESGDGEGSDDDEGVSKLVAELDEVASEVERTRANLDSIERAAKVAADNPAVERAAAGRPISTHEPLTYRKQGSGSFFTDAYFAQRTGDTVARERLERHGREMAALYRERGLEFRDVGTSAFAGLTVPQYLVDEWAEFARANAPFWNMIRKAPLPAEGMTVNISRITTGAAVAAQANENDAAQETNIDDTLLTINVRTFSGQQDVSRQALERGSLVDEVIYQDLVSDYFTKVDASAIGADGTSGTHLGLISTGSINTVAYTDATPTVPELYLPLAKALSQIDGNRYASAQAWLMHPRRWWWMLSSLDSSNRPFVVPNANGPYNAIAVGTAVNYGQVVGTLLGLPVVTDANVPTTVGAGTEDVIFAMRTSDIVAWEDGDGFPRRFLFEQHTNAPSTIRLAVSGYSAFTAGRQPKGIAKVYDTGLIAQSGF